MTTKRIFIGTILLIGILLIGNVMAQEIQVPFTYEIPVAMTAPGQSPEIAIVSLLARRVKLEIKSEPFLKPEALNGFKTPIIIIGGSGKGLGAAGVDIQEESERTKNLIAGCKEKEIKIIGMHLGGETRRGPNSDKMIKLVTPCCDYVIVRADGNQDEIFNQICNKNKIPLTEIEKSIELVDFLKALFSTVKNNTKG